MKAPVHVGHDSIAANPRERSSAAGNKKVRDTQILHWCRPEFRMASATVQVETKSARTGPVSVTILLRTLFAAAQARFLRSCERGLDVTTQSA